MSEDVREELRAVARDLLGTSAAPAVQQPTRPSWSALADAGWLGLEVDEDHGGSGATFAETAVVVEELARAAALSPYLGSTVLAAGALALLEPSAGRDDLLRASAAGDVVLALADGDGAFTLDAHRLSGHADFVLDAPAATQLLIVARSADGEPVVVRAPASDLSITPQPVLDETRQLGTATAEGLVIDPASALRFGGDPHVALATLRSRAAVAVAADSLGIGEAMLAATVAYAVVRKQFDRPIGSFQAVKHACADMHVQLRVGRELLDAAITALVDGDDDADRAASRVKSYLGDAAVTIAGQAMQLHGGIGYTWESGVHLYLKRAMLNRALFGSPTIHRRHLAQRWT